MVADRTGAARENGRWSPKWQWSGAGVPIRFSDRRLP
jgi:hypothetical protein